MTFAEVYEKCGGRYAVLSMRPESAGIGREHDFSLLYASEDIEECRRERDLYVRLGYEGVFICPCMEEAPLPELDLNGRFAVLGFNGEYMFPTVEGTDRLTSAEAARMFRILWGI